MEEQQAKREKGAMLTTEEEEERLQASFQTSLSFCLLFALSRKHAGQFQNCQFQS